MSDLWDSPCDTLDEVCDQLDTRYKGCGNYYHVLRSRGIKHSRIKSRFEKHDQGPSAALFEYLRAAKPEMTVEEFNGILRRKRINRKDVIQTLKAFDSSQ